MTHPAYPNAATVRAQQNVARLVEDARQNNAKALSILQLAIGDLERWCDLTGPSMAPGYDLKDIVSGLRDMLPRIDDTAELAKLDEWARDRVEDVVT